MGLGPGVVVRQGLRRLAVGATPVRPVGLRPHAALRVISLSDEVHGLQDRLAGTTRLAGEVQRPAVGVPVGLHEEVGEGWVHFVGPGV